MQRRRATVAPVDAAFALPIGALGMLAIGVAAALAGTADRAGLVTALTCLLVAVLGATAAPSAALPLSALGWFTISGFSRTPVGELHGASSAAFLAVTVATATGLCTGWVGRRGAHPVGNRGTMDAVPVRPRFRQRAVSQARRAGGTAGMSTRRRVAGLVLAALLLPGLTAVLVALESHLALVDELLFYLLTVVGITLVGGFWPAVVAALAAGLLLNWFFTPPLHTWTIEDPKNLLALLLFVASAVTVSSVVHLAARRGAIAQERTAEAEALLALARTVLGDDTPQAVLAHLRETTGLAGVLEERAGERWVTVAGSAAAGERVVVPAGATFRLAVTGEVASVNPRVLEGIAAQAASSCERQRLRVQAEQNEALAAGNRMRTALLAAVSHDLRTPLSSVKAAVSSLRLQDVSWSAADRADLLATIEEGADRLGDLIGNLLDMSRIHTGAVQPFLRGVSLDEVLPAVVRGVTAAAGAAVTIRLHVPDDLPLLETDPVLLDRALANVLSNALRYSPPGRPPTVVARLAGSGDGLLVEVVDHGPGVPEGQRDRVFEPFQQLGDQRNGNGVGLGLAVAKGFVEALGGTITADATPGGGLTMRVSLPTATTRDAGGVGRSVPA